MKPIKPKTEQCSITVRLAIKSKYNPIVSKKHAFMQCERHAAVIMRLALSAQLATSQSYALFIYNIQLYFHFILAHSPPNDVHGNVCMKKRAHLYHSFVLCTIQLQGIEGKVTKKNKFVMAEFRTRFNIMWFFHLNTVQLYNHWRNTGLINLWPLLCHQRTTLIMYTNAA